MANVNFSVKSIIHTNNDIWHPKSCENSMYLNNTVDNSAIMCSEIVTVTDSVSTNLTNAIAAKQYECVLINSVDKK